MFFGFVSGAFGRASVVGLCVLFLCASVVFADESKWDGVAKVYPDKGDGSAEDPFILDSAAKLFGLQFWVNTADLNADKHYRLTADIDLAGKKWTPIGTDRRPFKGVFDGGGHIVRNLYVQLPGTEIQGLFGYVQSANISNLGLISAQIKTGMKVGGLVGHASVSNLENSFVFGCISGEVNSGGLAGLVEGTSVRNCFSSASVNGRGSFTGGLIGTTSYRVGESIVEGCHANGPTTAESGGKAAGLLGSNRLDCSLTNAYTTGNVRGSGTSVAGVIGYTSSGALAKDIAFDPQGTGQSRVIAVGSGGASNVLAISADILADGALPTPLSANWFVASPDSFPQLQAFQRHPSRAFRDASALAAVPLFFTTHSTSRSSDGVLKAPSRDSEGNELAWGLRENVGFVLESAEPNRIILLLTHGEKSFDVSNRLLGASKEFFVSADIRQGTLLTLTDGGDEASCEARFLYNGVSVDHATIRFAISGDNTSYTAHIDLHTNEEGMASFHMPTDAPAGNYDVYAKIPGPSWKSNRVKLKIPGENLDESITTPVDPPEEPDESTPVLPEAPEGEENTTSPVDPSEEPDDSTPNLPEAPEGEENTTSPVEPSEEPDDSTPNLPEAPEGEENTTSPIDPPDEPDDSTPLLPESPEGEIGGTAEGDRPMNSSPTCDTGAGTILPLLGLAFGLASKRSPVKRAKPRSNRKI